MATDIENLTAATNSLMDSINASKASLEAKAVSAAASAATAQSVLTDVLNAGGGAGGVHSAPAKPTPADADELGITDSAAGWVLKKLTFANLKAWIGGLFVSKSGDTIGGNLNVTGNVLVTGGGGLGYGIGSGGTVTQATSKSTAVTLNKPSGRITMNGATLAAGASVSFSLLNSTVTAGDLVLVQARGFAANLTYRTWTDVTSNGAAIIALQNISAGSLSEAVVIDFAVLKVSSS